MLMVDVGRGVIATRCLEHLRMDKKGELRVLESFKELSYWIQVVFSDEHKFLDSYTPFLQGFVY